MQTEALQRTLLIGVGDLGAQTADQLLAALPARWHETGLVQAVAVQPDDVSLSHISTTFTSPAADWPAKEVQQLEQVLRDISQLEHLARLRRRGVTLRYADEIHAIILANPAEAALAGSLTALIRILRRTTGRVLDCPASLTGVWLAIPPAADGRETTANEELAEAGNPRLLLDRLPLSEFDRGCFVAGLINEVGLIVGDTDMLIRRTVAFLDLVIREVAAGLAGRDEIPAGWGVPLTSFGLARVDWPGSDVTRLLSDRWTHTMLKVLVAPPVPQKALADKAQSAARQWLQSSHWVPSLLLEHLAAHLPALPNRLAALVPETPWPWLLVDIHHRLEQAGRQWQDGWLADHRLLPDTLAELLDVWPEQAEKWLTQQVAAFDNGHVVVTHAYLAAVSEHLHSFITDLENRLEEAQQDLANSDERVRTVAGPLADLLQTMPESVFSALLQWGPHPFRWPAYGARCREAQTMARQLAPLIRDRLMMWQTVSLYEDVLPFYRRLQTLWGELVERWTGHCEQVRRAAQTPDVAAWPDRLDETLACSTGPWDRTLVTALYEEAVARNGAFVADRAGTFTGWQAEQLAAADIVQRLQQVTHQAMAEALAIPVDRLLCRRFPTPAERLEWLAGLLEQARPFWRFDETRLAETARAQVRQESWLLLPDADNSPLAELEQIGPHPVRAVSNQTPEQMGVVVLRRWLHGIEPEDEPEEPTAATPETMPERDQEPNH